MSSTSRNTDGPMTGGGGSEAFHSSVERSEPMQTGGHKPGVLVGNDAKPEFSAETLPAGSAPSDSTFQPNNPDTAPPTQQYQESSSIESDAPQASAMDGMPGATSADVHTGLGHPGSGQTSSELRSGGNVRSGGHDGMVSGAKQTDIDTDAMPSQRALDSDEATTGRGTVGGAAAQEREPETSERVASERN